MSASELHIVGWDRFQHYKDRWPPWIKNYNELLANHQYLGLSAHRRAILHGLWLAYAMSHGQLTDNTSTLSRQLSLRVMRRDLAALEAAGFIALQSHSGALSASKLLAKRYADASPHALARDREDKEGQEQTQEQEQLASNVASKERRTSYAPSYEGGGYLRGTDDGDFRITTTPTHIGDIRP